MILNKKPLVSIIINCYNGSKYLSHTIESILNQTYTNFEVIFWDNKSTDNSKEIFKKRAYFYSNCQSYFAKGFEDIKKK